MRPRLFSWRCKVMSDRHAACVLHIAHKTDPMLARLLAVFVIATSSLVARADLYSCITPDGRSALQPKPCQSGKHKVRKVASKNSAPSASPDSNLPAVAKRKCIEVGYLPLDEAEFDKCQEDILQDAYKAVCEQAGRAGERLNACIESLRTQDELHARRMQLDYYCIARDKPFGSPQYRVCTGAIK